MDGPSFELEDSLEELPNLETSFQADERSVVREVILPELADADEVVEIAEPEDDKSESQHVQEPQFTLCEEKSANIKTTGKRRRKEVPLSCNVELEQVADGGEVETVKRRRAVVRPSYKCGKCGEPKRGHRCALGNQLVPRVFDTAWDGEGDMFMPSSTVKSDKLDLANRYRSRWRYPPIMPGLVPGFVMQVAEKLINTNMSTQHAHLLNRNSAFLAATAATFAAAARNLQAEKNTQDLVAAMAQSSASFAPTSAVAATAPDVPTSEV